MGRKLVIDVDTGIDDALALMLALQHPDVEVIGVTCVFGNANVDQVCENTLRVLKLCGKTQIPVFKGASRPLVQELQPVPPLMGSDGMGEVDWPDKIDTSVIQSEFAVTGLLRLVNENPGEITLVCLASLTNIALALKLDPQFGRKLKDVYFMGGNIEGQGNSSICSEFNVMNDPEAAHIVLSQMEREITVFPLETCLKFGLPWQLFDKLSAMTTAKAQFLVKIAKYSFEILKSRLGRQTCDICDFFAMAAVVDNACAVETVDVYATVELQGSVTRGQMVVDWFRQLGGKPNVRIVKSLCVEKLKELVFFTVDNHEDKMLFLSPTP